MFDTPAPQTCAIDNKLNVTILPPNAPARFPRSGPVSTWANFPFDFWV
jgi:hypothetical protein